METTSSGASDVVWPGYLALGSIAEAESVSLPASLHPDSLRDACAEIEHIGLCGGVAACAAGSEALAVGYLVASGRARLADAIRAVAVKRVAGHSDSADPADPADPEPLDGWLRDDALPALLRLEMSVRGEPSDLSELGGCPARWCWTHWASGRQTTLVGRGRAVEVQRLRPDPRMARLRHFLTADEAAHIIALARASLRPSRVVNHGASLRPSPLDQPSPAPAPPALAAPPLRLRPLRTHPTPHAPSLLRQPPAARVFSRRRGPHTRARLAPPPTRSCGAQCSALRTWAA